MGVLEGTQAKAFLVLAKCYSALFRPMSINVVREVCTYLDFNYVLGVLKFESTILKLLDFSRNRTLEMEAEEPVQPGSAVCAISDIELLLVSTFRGTKVFDLINKSAKVVESPIDKRMWPGIVTYGKFVYLFGGSYTCIQKSCEKFHIESQTWTSCPDMCTSKSCFTPCVHQQEIYLAASESKWTPLEVFTPATEQYRLLPLRIYTGRFGSVASIVDGELFFLNYAKKAFRWRLDSQETAATTIHCRIPEHNLMLCAGAVVLYRQFMCWATSNGELAIFSWKDNSLMIKLCSYLAYASHVATI